MTTPDSWLQRIEDKLDKALECNARHDERIRTIERAGKWISGIIAALISGICLHFTIGKP